MKYSINSAGRIVAERDIYSLGGFIPKGRLGGFIADETQLSQEGECWLDSGDISTRPDVRIKDNAFIGGFFRGENPVHTDIVTEFSGNTLIPGSVSIRCFAADTKNNVFVKDSFIGVSMDVLCGPESDTKAFPFEQGRYIESAAKGTLFTSATMKADADNFVRNTATLRLGKNTYVYLPTGLSARIYWGYYDASGQLAYAGESEVVSSSLYKISHPVYKVCMITFAKNPTFTPTDLLATGAKILGLISGSVLTDIRPESASGQYMMVNSSFIAETDNFGLNATQLRFLAGRMYNTNMYTKTDRQDYKPYGTFHNVERLEYTKYLGDSHRTAATRDTYISAYDCPLLRVDDDTYDTSLMGTGDLVLRRCIVPKGRFVADPINGNTYEDLDFSYVNEFMGGSAGNRTLVCSHRQGLYSLYAASGSLTGLVSYPENTKNATSITEKHVNIPLDGDIIEQGAYGAGGAGSYYEAAKSDSPIRIRTGKPLSTLGLIFPSLPAGYSVKALYYLDEDFVIRSTATDPAGIVTTYPYVVMLFKKDDDSAINVTDFIALNGTLRITDHTKVPEITGSAYIGAGCTVRGDVKLIGDPYVNRVFDVNMWEVGTMSGDLAGLDYEAGKAPTFAGNRYRFVEAFPVESGGTISCAAGYYMYAYWYGEDGLYLSQSNWNQTFTVSGPQKFVGIVLKKAANAADAGGLIKDSDIPLAKVMYLRAFKKRRYITNELDRTSPEDILLGPDYWEQGIVARTVGEIYSDLKQDSPNYIRLRTPVNTGENALISQQEGFAKIIIPLDASTKCRSEVSGLIEKTPLLAVVWRKDPTSATIPADISSVRMVIEFTPSPRIVVPYGSSTLLISGPKIRMYDNAVLSRNLNHDADIVLQGDAVMGYDFSSGDCLCSNGHDDAIIKLP